MRIYRRVSQIVLSLHASCVRWFFFKITPKKKIYDWVVIGAETAGMLERISSEIPDSCSVNISPYIFHKYRYNYEFPVLTNSKFSILSRNYFGAKLLGKLSAKAKGFYYLGSHGLLNIHDDGRESEFKYLKARNIKIVCQFIGSDIRSIKLSQEAEKRTGKT
ncbi:MAG: hypothetical protein KF916_06215 [Microbacteriaceae bacterium]|nr:hypothetical protein [Microbacteriaceae bacterium]